MWKHATTCLLATSLLVAGGAARAGTDVSVPAVAALTIDGDLADWKGVPILYLEDGPRVTAFAHDGRFLYVSFHFSDLELARRVLANGAIVWVNGNGRHVTDYGLRYRGSVAAEAALRGLGGAPAGPPPDMPGPPPAAREKDQPPSSDGRPQRAALGALEIVHSGAATEVIAGGASADGAAVACRVEDGVFVYEIRVPLAATLPASAKGAVPSKLAVGFQMNGVTAAERKAMQERMRSTGHGEGGARGGGFAGGDAPPGGGPGGMGGGPPGGMPGGSGGPGGPPGFAGGGGRERGEAVVWVDVALVPAAASTPTPGK